ncbi:hypothetical protein OG440_39740 (plasmid) [Streptomyces sp. NBC_00637]|uniref:hypothetical protein n=1 Tax=Streptomyces sp. NBC_00637 TaxID=2903667 RepID=UPI002F9100DF
MPIDVHAAVGALVRAELARTHTPCTQPTTPERTHPPVAAQVLPATPSAWATTAPTTARPNSRRRFTLALRRLVTIFG